MERFSGLTKPLLFVTHIIDRFTDLFMVPGIAAHARPPLFKYAMSRNTRILFNRIAVNRRFLNSLFKESAGRFQFIMLQLEIRLQQVLGNGPSAARHVSHLTNTFIARQICVRHLKTLHPEFGFEIFL